MKLFVTLNKMWPFKIYKKERREIHIGGRKACYNKAEYKWSIWKMQWKGRKGINSNWGRLQRKMAFALGLMVKWNFKMWRQAKGTAMKMHGTFGQE